MALFQLYWQFQDGHTKVCAQRDITGGHNEIRDWFKEIEASHPLPEGAVWMICNELSEHFVWMNCGETNENRG